MSLIHVAVGVVRRHGGDGPEVLVARRPDHLHQGGLLEFPGGKVEPSEGVASALCRELAEETGLEVHPETLNPLIQIHHDYGDREVLLDVWETDAFSGKPEGLEGQPVFWMPITELRDEAFPVANRPIIRSLRLPEYALVTGPGLDTLSSKHFSAMLAGRKPALCVIRIPELSRTEYLLRFRELGSFCSQAGHLPLVHGAPAEWADAVGAGGLHMPWSEAAQCTERPVDEHCWLGVSCHDAEQLAHAQRIGADYAFLSPLRHTASHPERAPLGAERFAALVRGAALPVYALGGLGENDLAEVKVLGGQGVAGIGFWWDYKSSS